jgi:hypothetical protein
LEYLPSLSSAVNKGALLGNRFVTIHVEIDLFSSLVAVVLKHDSLGSPHCSLSVEASTGIVRPAAAIHKSRTILSSCILAAVAISAGCAGRRLPWSVSGAGPQQKGLELACRVDLLELFT